MPEIRGPRTRVRRRRKEDGFVIFQSRRCGIRPTSEEIKKGDYQHFPFGRFKGKVERGKSVPLLWQRYPHPDGQRVVGYSNGTAKTIPEAEFHALMKKHGQDP